MNIPESSIEPFGYTDIPKIVMVRQGENPALLARIFSACELTKKDAITKWRILRRFIELGMKVSPHMELDEYILRLRAVFAGGTDVECNIKSFDVGGVPAGFYMSITFNVPGDDTRYGSYLEYPDGEGSDEHS